MKHKFFLAVLLFAMVLCSSVPVSAATYTTYADLASTATQAVNLVNYAANQESFEGSDFVVFRADQYDYMIAWAPELTVSGNTISGSVEYVRYYRTDNYGDYYYTYGSDAGFVLSPTYQVTSNIGIGFRSLAAEQYEYYNDGVQLTVLGVGLLFVIMCVTLRR